MSAINSLSGNSYYQLTDPATDTADQTATPTLADLLQSTASQPAPSSLGEAYLLDLSQESQQYLNSSPTDSSSQNSETSFTLTAQQQKAIDSILAKYKDAPFTQDTFNKIQDDLKAAGLDPTLLSAKDKVDSFNPTQVFLDVLNGGSDSVPQQDNAPSDSDEQAKSQNYIQQIISRWQGISTQVSGSTDITS